MPNHVQNVIRLHGDEKRIREVLEAIKNDQYGVGSVDFEKIIPMPPALHIECGSKTEQGLTAYRGFLKSDAESVKEYLDQNPDITPEEWELGKQACENICNYGAPTWYEWRIARWGTKWNAYGMSENTTGEPKDELRFQTAWSAPHPLLERLSEMYPDVVFEHEWADEDLGSNCGRKKLLDGETIEIYYPEGTAAMGFAMDMWGYEPADLELALNSAETKYIDTEADNYELIELFGKPALFSNERISANDIPAGLYCYNLRHTDDGSAFATIEPRVRVNFAGSVITDTPIDFGKQKSIAFTEETSPNFLGQELTFGEYMRGEFEMNEEQENKMEDML